tara:strand:- start:5707 stop:7170 length:1464 start_codon:yes stop_codon:yes gene_type:complete
MINIQRNFFIETILFETEMINHESFKDLPYKDNIVTSKSELEIIFFDIDRVDNLQTLIKDLILIKGKTLFIPVSKNEDKLNKFIKKINTKKNNSLILIDINKIDVIKRIDIKRERIYKSYLSFELQSTLSKILDNIVNLILNKDIRLISLDLDNTCWTGIIGEEGISKIYLDNFQKKAMEFINKLIIKTGLIVSFHSKNNEEIGIKGIKKKLSNYSNLVSKSFKYISWDSKLYSIKKVTKLVNFSKKNIIYFDDNISEIKQLNRYLVKKNCMWIKNSYLLYLYTKSIYISNSNKEKNIKRFKDIKSNLARTEITDNYGILNYVKSSNIKIIFSSKKIETKRLIEMSNKTNQFNSNYKRISSKDVNKFSKDKSYKIVTFSVSDKYSDSGIIASLIIKNYNKYDAIIEFTMSCRALGRGLEYIFINLISKKFSIKDMRINYIKTNKNEPFIKFAEKIKLKKDKTNYWINLRKIKKISENYEKYIKVKTN